MCIHQNASARRPQTQRLPSARCEANCGCSGSTSTNESKANESGWTPRASSCEIDLHARRRLSAPSSWFGSNRPAAGLQALAGHAGHVFVDVQGAWELVPAFQIGLFTSLWAAVAGRAGWRRAALGIGVLALAQAALTPPVGELAHHYGFDPHVGLIRGWALAAPAALAWRLRRPPPDPTGSPIPVGA